MERKDMYGKVVVVTGAAGVLCSAIVEDMLLHGANVALIGRHKAKLEAQAKRMKTKGLDRTLVVEADVLDRSALKAGLGKILRKWKRVDVLVNGAGGHHPNGVTKSEQMTAETPAEDTFLGLEMEAFEHVNKLNFIGTVLPCQVFLPELVKTRGSIVNVSSMAAWQPMTKGAAYAAAKAGVSNFTLWLANHLAPTGVRVNAVARGFFITDQNRFLLMEQDGTTPTPRGRRVLAHTPMGCFGSPSDLCGPVRFLVSADARFVTGVVLPVDGGFMASSGV